MVTEHCFPIGNGESYNLEVTETGISLVKKGTATNGVDYYELQGTYESDPIEIGDLFKGYKELPLLSLAYENFGAFVRASGTTAKRTDDGKAMTFNGYMPAADTYGIGGNPFSLKYNRYFEFSTTTNTNRYLHICLVPENVTSGATNYTLAYMLQNGLAANTRYGFKIDVENKGLVVLKDSTVVYSKSLSNFNFDLNYRIVIRSGSSRNHTGTIHYARESFAYELPTGYVSIFEEPTDENLLKVYTSTSLDGAIWEEYRKVSGGSIMSSVGKYIKVKFELYPIYKEFTFKEYDYETKDESGRVLLNERAEFKDGMLTSIKSSSDKVEGYLEGENQMYRYRINTVDNRIDSLRFNIK